MKYLFVKKKKKTKTKTKRNNLNQEQADVLVVNMAYNGTPFNIILQLIFVIKITWYFKLSFAINSSDIFKLYWSCLICFGHLPFHF